MKKILLIMIFSSIVFGQYHMQTILGVEDGVKVQDFEKAMVYHNKAHENELGAVNTFVILNGPHAGKYVRSHAGEWPIPADKIDAIYNAHSNHPPLTYDKWNDSMITQETGTEFYTIRLDLSYNVQYKPYKYLTMYVYNVAQSGNETIEWVFNEVSEIRKEQGSDAHYVVMVKNLGGNLSEYVVVRGHDTMSEVLDQSEFQQVLATLYQKHADLDAKWKSAVWGLYSQTLEWRPDLSTNLDNLE